MTQQEFETRVQVKVSTQEYWHINEVYNNSDLDKDEFCKLWVKMNQGRVNKAREIQKAIDEDMKQREGLYDIINRDWSDVTFEPATEKFNKTQQQLLAKVGIELEEERFGFLFGTKFMVQKLVGTVIFEIKKYLKVA